MIGGTVSIPFLICPKLCIGDEDPARGYIIATLFFVSGIVTFLQSTFGVRLPIVQGGTFTFVAPTFAILLLESNKCPADFGTPQWLDRSQANRTEEWQIRMRQVQGAIIVASVFQVIIGYFGIIGIMLNYITPLTIAPSVSMIGISLFKDAANSASTNWLVSMSTSCLLIISSQYLKDVPLPFPFWRRSGCRFKKTYIFRLFPVLITITIMWIICTLMTVTDFLDVKNPARADSNLGLIQEVNWFRMPYPCK